jgi:hypothetical protein
VANNSGADKVFGQQTFACGAASAKQAWRRQEGLLLPVTHLLQVLLSKIVRKKANKHADWTFSKRTCRCQGEEVLAVVGRLFWNYGKIMKKRL